MSKSKPTSKRKAEDDVAAAQPSSKKSSASHGKKSKSQKSPASLSEEDLFKIKHAAEFDGESIRGELDDGTRVKQESEDDDHITVSPRRVTRSCTRIAKDKSCSTKPTSAPATPEEVSRRTGSHDDADKDSIFVAILSQASWDLNMTESAVDNLSRRALQAASNGELFDVGYVKSMIDRLDRAGIEFERRSHVVSLLKLRLRHALDYWSSCIGSVGSEEHMPPTLPGSHATTSQRLVPCADTTPKSSKVLYVDVSPAKLEGVETRNLQSSNDHSDSTSDRDSENSDSESESDSEYSEHKGTSPAKARTIQTSAVSSMPSTATKGDKTATNVQLYGTGARKAAFDILVRCIIFAWAAAPHPGDTPTNIREYARPKWRKVPWEQKCAWQKLYEERGDPAVDELKRGVQLVLSQDLLRAFVPSDRFPAALLRCQQNQTQVVSVSRVDPPSDRWDVGDLTDFGQSDEDLQGLCHLLYTENYVVRTSQILENFPRFAAAKSDTPRWKPCLIPSSVRHPDPRTCIFILNSPDVPTNIDTDATQFRSACRDAGIRGLTKLGRHEHNLFVAFFSNDGDAAHARRKARLQFPASPAAATPSLRIQVKPESHWIQVNRTFFCDVRRSQVNPDTVPRRVFEALDGPLAPYFHLLKWERKRGNKKPTNRVRFLLRPVKDAPPISVERFYIPLKAKRTDSGNAFVWGIFKPHCKNWLCPSCKERCQSGEVSTCPFAIEIPRVVDDAR